MNQRQEQLLFEIAEEYLKTAQAVGSKLIADKYHTDLSPATIRNDMAFLEEEGYVYQPHVSAGRIPTEKGYQYLLKHIDWDKMPSRQEKQSIMSEVDLKDKEQAVRQIAKNTARLSRNAVVVSRNPSETYYTGLAYLFSHPEFSHQARVCSISEVVDHLDEVMGKILPHLSKGKVNVMIGSDNPFGSDCGAVMTRYEKDGIFGVLGPVRMNYQENVGRLNYIRSIIQ